MGVIGQNFNSVYRDYETDGVPSSGEHRPRKSEIRSLIGAVLDEIIIALQEGQAGGGLAYATRDDLYANTTAEAGQKAEVWNDPTSSRNGVYTSDGSGSGSDRWTKISDLSLTSLTTDVAGLLTDVAQLETDVDGIRDQVIYEILSAATDSNTPAGTYYSGTLSPNSIPSLSRPLFIVLRPPNGNNGSPVYLTVTGLSGMPKEITDSTGASLPIGAIRADRAMLLWYDGDRLRKLSDDRADQVIDLLSRMDDAEEKIDILDRGIAYFTQNAAISVNAVSGTVVTVTTEQEMSNIRRPRTFIFRWPSDAETNKGPVTLIINGLWSMPVETSSGTAVNPGDFVPGNDYEGYYDGDSLRITSGPLLSNILKTGVSPRGPSSWVRPGDSPWMFSTTLSGAPETTAATRLYEYRTDTDGRVVPVRGELTITPIDLYRMEPGRFYKARWVFRRRVDTLDPANDAVRCGIVWLDRNGTQISTAVYENVLDVTVGGGRIQKEAILSTISRSEVDIQPPASAVYFRPFLQTFGTSQELDLETMEVRDITDYNIISPTITSVESRLSAIESLDLGDRVTNLETITEGPRVQTYETMAAAVVATPEDSTNIIRLLGYYDAGKGGGHYRYVPAEPTEHDAWLQTADGRYWEHADPTIDVLQVGAVVDGETDDSSALSRWILAGAVLGKKCTAFVAGILMATAVQIENVGAVNMDIECGPSFCIKGIAESDRTQTQKILTIDSGVSDTLARPDIRWRGGWFNNADLAYGNPDGTPWDQGSGSARGGCLGFTRYRNVYLEAGNFQGGTHYFDENGTYADQSVVGGDQAVTFINCINIYVSGCYFAGQPDNGLYPRHNSPLIEAGVMKVFGCTFYRCHSGFHAKFAGGRVEAFGNDFRECRDAIRCWADYNPNENDDEVGSFYQPYECILVGNRFNKISRYAIDCERVQFGSVADNLVIDWGYRLDGEPDVAVSRPYSSAFRFHGCRNIAFTGNVAGLRDWDGSAHLEFFLSEGDSGGDVANPSWISHGIVATGNRCSAAPYDYDEEEGIAEETVDSERIGFGVMFRVRGSTDGTHEFYNNSCPDAHILTQKYLFENSSQYVVERPSGMVASPEGTPWDGGMLGPYSGGLLSLGERNLEITQSSEGATGGDNTASPVRFTASCTDAGSNWDTIKPFASFDCESGDGSGAGATVRVRWGAVMEGTSGGQSKAVIQVIDAAGSPMSLTTAFQVTTDLWTTAFGNFSMFPDASVTPATNGELTFEATNNSTITVKYKGSDGTVRTATIALT
jgi:hypothetical protein